MATTKSDLSPLENTILQVAAAYQTPVGRTKLMETLRQMGERLPDGSGIQYASFKPLVDRLQKHHRLEDTGAGLSCPARDKEKLLDEAISSGRLTAIAQAMRATKKGGSRWDGFTFYRDYDTLIRDLRVALVVHDVASVEGLIAYAFHYFSQETYKRHPLIAVEPRGILGPLYTLLSPALYQTIILLLARDGKFRLEAQSGLRHALRDTPWSHPDLAWQANRYLAEYDLLAGDGQAARARVAKDDDIGALNLRAWADLVDGDLTAAGVAYENAYQALRKSSRKRNLYFDDLAGAFSLLPLLANNQLDTVLERAERATKDKDNILADFYGAWHRLARVRLGAKPEERDFRFVPEQPPSPFSLLLLLAYYWIDPSVPRRWTGHLTRLVELAQDVGFHWLADQARALLARCEGQAPPASSRLPLVDLMRRVESWEPVLEALAAFGTSGARDTATGMAADSPERLVWWLSLGLGGLAIQPRLQKRTRNGGWTQGRPVALERLAANELDCMDEHDRRISAGIVETYDNWGWGRVSHEFDPRRALPALVGHPRLFRADDPGVSLEVVAAEPELHVQRDGDRLKVTLEPPLPDDDISQLLTEESRGRLRLVSYSSAHRHIGQLLGEGLNCPLDAEARVRQAVSRIAPLVIVHSDIGGDENLPQVAGDDQPHLVLTPWGEGLEATLLVRPLGAGGPGYPPGLGGEELTASNAAGVRQRVRRDLAEERRRADALVTACPALGPWEVASLTWQLPTPGDALALLEQVHGLTEAVAVEWPKGQNIDLAGRGDAKDLRLSLRRRGDWFEASGELQVDESLVLDLQQLLSLLESGNDRFLPLGDGRFLALTEGFRRRLDDLRQLADSAARKPRFHPLTAPLLDEIGASLGRFDTDQAWQAQIQRLRSAGQTAATIPSTFEAELRDYQADGYRWLMQLADWGVGACLADDMGLGKTIQLLAMLVARAPQGPSLVVAPTSVCGNWLAETARFAPTLNAILFGPGDRQAAIDRAGPFDLLICSYGLLQAESTRLAARQDWNCLVLDEAQAIKNPATARAKAAFLLQAGFRIATTGTPIENHLGELWSLFRFINPGLLSSREAFNRRYAGPIERDGDHAARDRLRRLVRPFFLRRLKSDVLDELPARTEIVLQTEPGPEETAFYEGLRRQALEELDSSQTAAKDQRFQVLAALTRLRRAACNPQLVMPDTAIPSGKLALFLETVEELREGRHKALVFSQFVDHLTLVRNALDERDIRYQYLDGATPAKQRTQRVAAFQAGEGELFLISLKAGGFGLNLTAADYVIHLDPWWNPAAEDQASDRAHRIGQQRPVTVYRLVSKGSIEERILNLHAQKRELADSLLEGGDAAARLDTADLLALMQEAPADATPRTP